MKPERSPIDVNRCHNSRRTKNCPHVSLEFLSFLHKGPTRQWPVATLFDVRNVYVERAGHT